MTYEVHIDTIKTPNEVRCRNERWETNARRMARNTGCIVHILMADDTLVTFARKGYTSAVNKKSYKPGKYTIKR